MEKKDKKENFKAKPIIARAIVELQRVALDEERSPKITGIIDHALLFMLKGRNPIAYEKLVIEFPNWEAPKKRGPKPKAQAQN